VSEIAASLGWVTIMKTVLGALALALVVLAGPAQARLITFDDRTPVAQALTSYEGLDWENMSTLGAVWYAGFEDTGFGHGTVSPENVAFNAGGDVVGAVSLATGTFDFESAYFTAAWIDGLQLRIQGFNDGLELFSQVLNLDTAGPTFFAAGWGGLDKLTFTTWYDGCSCKGRQFVMDNLKLTSEVPEPSTWAMLVVGFGGVGVLIRGSRRREQAATA